MTALPNMRSQLWFPLAVLSVLAVLSFWLEQTIQEASARKGVNQKEPDSMVENFLAISTDPSGAPRYKLTATKLMHFSDSKITLLDQPELAQVMLPEKPKRGAQTQLPPKLPRGEIKISSTKATVSPGGETVSFKGDVLVSRRLPNGQTDLTMKTALLEAFPDKGLVSTRSPVVIEQAGMRINANGLNLSANTRVLKLSGRVKVLYKNSHVRA